MTELSGGKHSKSLLSPQSGRTLLLKVLGLKNRDSLGSRRGRWGRGKSVPSFHELLGAEEVLGKLWRTGEL